jgi:hypothetical protein
MYEYDLKLFEKEKNVRFGFFRIELASTSFVPISLRAVCAIALVACCCALERILLWSFVFARFDRGTDGKKSNLTRRHFRDQLRYILYCSLLFLIQFFFIRRRYGQR